jgi:mannosyltransferase OCH1-like enzyme
MNNKVKFLNKKLKYVRKKLLKKNLKNKYIVDQIWKSCSNKEKMVPYVIHLIWFGPSPENIKQKIKSWKLYNPQFKIWLWTRYH